MCEVCDFYKKLTPASKADPAIGPNSARTIYGYYHEGDAEVLASFYPKVGQALIGNIASLINHPRLLEVAGLVELVERYLESSFSKLRDVAINVVSNPLSIFFWSPRDQTVHRVKTLESEMMHGAMEKMALRRGSIDLINDLLGSRHNIAVTYGCSCCAIAVAASDLPYLYASEYYRQREGLGRLFDSDVLTTHGKLFGGVSVSDVPQQVLDASADFGLEEVMSYSRFSKASQAVLAANPVTPDLSEAMAEVRRFLLGCNPAAVAA